MGLFDRIAAWLKTARLRRKARQAAGGAVAPHVASAAVKYFAKHPSARECVIGQSPEGAQLFTRKDLDRLTVVTKGVGDRIFARTLVGGAAYGSPGGWTSDRFEQVLHYRHWSYLAVKAIGNELAGLVPSVAHVRHAGEPGAARKSLLERRHAKSLHTIKPHEDVEHAGPGHPLVRLFERPNAWDTAGDLWFELCLFLQLTGNAYLWAVPSRLGLLTGTNQPCELWVIPSHWVWPKLGPAGIDCYEVRPFQGPGTLRFPPEEIIHLRLKNPLHKIDGYSPQVAGAETIDALESVNRSRYWQFKNGCFPVGHLELGEQYADPSEEDLERVYAKFFRRFQGEQNYGAPIITGPGSKYNPLEIAPREMAYFESAEQLRDWVLALWGVPKEILGIQPAGNDLSWYAPLQQFCRFTMQPLLRYLGQALTRHLASRYDRSLRVWWEDPTPDNPDQLNKDLALDAANGWIAPNEARAVRGREPYPFGGDDPLLPPGLSPMPFATGEQLDMPLPPAQPPQPPAPPRKALPPARTKAAAPVADGFPDVRQSEAWDCGAACLRAVAEFYGVLPPPPDREEAFIRLLGTNPEDGTRPGRIVEGARRLGLDAQARGGMSVADLAAETKAGRVVICCTQQTGAGWDQGHYVTAIACPGKSVLVQDPVDGRKRVGRALWLKRWHDADADGQRYERYGIVIGKAGVNAEAA